MPPSCWWSIFFLFLTVKSSLVLHSHCYPISHHLVPGTAPGLFFPARVLFNTSSPSKLQAMFCGSALQPLSMADCLLKTSSSVKSAPFPPQKPLGQSMKCSSVHSLIHGERWCMTEAATCGGFLLVRWALYILGYNIKHIALKMSN